VICLTAKLSGQSSPWIERARAAVIVAMTISSSIEETFSPRRRRPSERRLTKRTKPSASAMPLSPVWCHRFSDAAIVASGRRQYPEYMPYGTRDRTTISPTVPGGTGYPSSSSTAISRCGDGGAAVSVGRVA
jgi:hypothetical protein